MGIWGKRYVGRGREEPHSPLELRTAPSHRLAALSSAPSPAHSTSCTAGEPGSSGTEVAAGRVLTSPGEPWLLGQTPELRGKGAIGTGGIQETDPEDMVSSSNS